MTSLYSVLKEFLLLMLGLDTPSNLWLAWLGLGIADVLSIFRAYFYRCGAVVVQKKSIPPANFKILPLFFRSWGMLAELKRILETVTSWSIYCSVSLQVLLVSGIGGLGISWKRWCRVQCVCSQRRQDTLRNSMHVILAKFWTLFLHVISMWLQWRRIFSSF